jgi:hypothetical protein
LSPDSKTETIRNNNLATLNIPWLIPTQLARYRKVTSYATKVPRVFFYKHIDPSQARNKGSPERG